MTISSSPSSSSLTTIGVQILPLAVTDGVGLDVFLGTVLRVFDDEFDIALISDAFRALTGDRANFSSNDSLPRGC
jgi:hypothetical protein